MSAAEVDGPAPSAARERPVPPPGGLAADVWRLYVHPGTLFADLPSRNRSALVLVLLVICQLLYAWAVVSLGVMDYETDWWAQKRVARAERHEPVDDRSAKQARALDALEKQAVFTKQFGRVVLLVGGPLRLLAGVGLLAGLLFLVVALRGGKPNYQLLAGVVIFASLVEVPRLLLRLWLFRQLGVGRVETSAAAFLPGAGPGLAWHVALRRLDPFDLWYWGLVWLGLVQTGQLRVRAAGFAVGGLALLTALSHSAADVLELADVG